jgi:hypothetical protein
MFMIQQRKCFAQSYSSGIKRGGEINVKISTASSFTYNTVDVVCAAYISHSFSTYCYRISCGEDVQVFPHINRAFVLLKYVGICNLFIAISMYSYCMFMYIDRAI